MSWEEVIKEAQEAIANCDEDKAVAVARQAIDAGLDLVGVLNEGFSAGIRKVGDMFGRGEIFLPELILSAEVMKKVTGVLEEAIAGGAAQDKKATILIATVEGDVHDIGKGIVISLLKTQGFEVIDLGRDVPVDRIIEEAIKVDADIIGTSALLTTTLAEQKKLEDELRARGLRERFKTIVGGAPCTQRWADKIGADAYGEDASDAVKKCLELIQK
ncbi:trimethylamine corrinoid protein MttC [Thermacetogenium phaeum DSM 12270]|uniref:Trimethylamine corrinoid protein MttC n=2 Tax=Thermacetogenium phaeum TaxID=85874 RepID=K4LLU7_THEPS|nr:corrinoid protein [Thermacetogenium phaeum]AFV12935.1 trimethylamine corrinoid protein MttC [Thermacetogenium phaeum DSM 12270]KUK37127.1 MAG: Trimethylamine corrinoid protein MttC [Thermacetogenium phaeum]